MYDLLSEEEASDGSYVIDFSATFTSGKWKETSIKNLPQLQQDLAGAKEWMSKNKGKVVFVQIEASESKVPNTDAESPSKPVLKPYELSNRRAVTINNNIANIFNNPALIGIPFPAIEFIDFPLNKNLINF
jgi:hypothetical protein